MEERVYTDTCALNDQSCRCVIKQHSFNYLKIVLSANAFKLDMSAILSPYKTLYRIQQQHKMAFGLPLVMGAIESLGCNWRKSMHQIDA